LDQDANSSEPRLLSHSEEAANNKEDLVKKIAEHRSALRERLVKFLTPEQLTKWDSAMAKVQEFLGQKMATCA
jgi:hypothetical protein